jgi:uncharacterized protein YeaO (DUF488 family)
MKRAYESPDKEDGARILVDRLWPRAVSKETLALDTWLKEIAPSTALRRWFSHDAERWPEFRRRYAAELEEQRDILESLRRRARDGRITLVFSAHDELHSNAAALRDFILHGLPLPQATAPPDE